MLLSGADVVIRSAFQWRQEPFELLYLLGCLHDARRISNTGNGLGG